MPQMRKSLDGSSLKKSIHATGLGSVEGSLKILDSLHTRNNPLARLTCTQRAANILCGLLLPDCLQHRSLNPARFYTQP